MLDTEKIKCRIEYKANNNPTCRVVVNDIVVYGFKGDSKDVDFKFEVPVGSFSFKIIHYGKDMKKEVDKFIEIKKIYFNDIDLKNMIWETTQVAEVPVWQDSKSYKWDGNLYFGHNGYIEYNLCSPIVDFLLEYHKKGAKVSSNMGSYNMDLLYEMKEYFTKIVREQDEKSQ